MDGITGGMNSRKEKVDYNKQSVSQQLEKHITLLSPQWSEEGLTTEVLEWTEGGTVPSPTR